MICFNDYTIIQKTLYFKCFTKVGENMSRAAVICEFNPFHNGHKFLLENIKRDHADRIVCIMSGAFVQRGDIAVTDKYVRTAAALDNGADIVIELPTVYAVSSARVFAENGVRLAAAMGCDKLCFGAESGIAELSELAALLDSEEVNERIAGYMSEGCYYPKALSLAVGADYEGVISLPNNILALEYIRVCRAHGIEPVALPRKGVNHDDARVSGEIASASRIRELMLSGGDYARFTPMKPEKPCALSAIEAAILFRLKTISPGELAGIAEVDEGLEHRIIEAARRYNSLEEILSAIKTKRYTMARLRRIAIQALLSITAEMQKTPVPYLRVLGMKRGSEDALKGAGLPLIIKTKADYEGLDNSAKEIFSVDLRAAEAMNIALGGESVNEFARKVIKTF